MTSTTCFHSDPGQRLSDTAHHPRELGPRWSGQLFPRETVWGAWPPSSDVLRCRKVKSQDLEEGGRYLKSCLRHRGSGHGNDSRLLCRELAVRIAAPELRAAPDSPSRQYQF